MLSSLKTRIQVLAFVSTCLLAVTAHAACGANAAPTFHGQSGHGSDVLRPGLLMISDRDDDSIVGMWHVTFTAEGNNPGPPDGTPIDNALVSPKKRH